MEPVNALRQGPVEDYDSDNSSLPDSAAKVQSLQLSGKAESSQEGGKRGASLLKDAAIMVGFTTLSAATLHGAHKTTDTLLTSVGTLVANSALKSVDFIAREQLRKVPLIPRYLSLMLVVGALIVVGHLTDNDVIQRIAIIIGGILLHVLFSTTRAQIRRMHGGRSFGVGDEFLRERTAANFMKALRGEKAPSKPPLATQLEEV